jgi:hypothetical protein
MGFQGAQGPPNGFQGVIGPTGTTGPTFSSLASYTATINVTGPTGGIGSNTVASSVSNANVILIRGFQATTPADVLGITDLFVTSASPNWTITLGVRFADTIDAAQYSIYYYGT